MLRTIIEIDQDLCIGCELCVNTCNEGAIAMVDGKAQMVRDDYCDGLGRCLPNCPTDAISFIEKEFEDVKSEPVEEPVNVGGGCTGTRAMSFEKNEDDHECCGGEGHDHDEDHECGCKSAEPKAVEKNVESYKLIDEVPSELRQWPVQIKLMPLKAPFYQNANLLIAADCCAFAYGNFHRDFMKNKVAVIGCPKLDDGDYAEKLTEIIKLNDIKSVTIARMQVPCCGGLENAAKRALQASGKFIPWNVVTLTTDGRILD